MNLKSCKNCGVVLDFDYIEFQPLYDIYGDLIIENAYWDGEDYITKILCPVCKEVIF